MFPQIRREFSPVQEPSSLRPSPGHRPVPAKHLVSTETAIKMRRNKIHQGQQSEAGAVSPKCSSQQDTRCTSAVVPKIDVSGAVMKGGGKVIVNAHTIKKHSSFCFLLQICLMQMKTIHIKKNTYHDLKFQFSQKTCTYCMIIPSKPGQRAVKHREM